MVVAEVLTGIALVKQSVDFIKSNIDTVNDIKQISDQIENMFVGEEQCQKARAKKAGVGMGDQFGIKSVAQEIIDAKLAQESMQKMRTMIDMRFGPGTWQTIVDERARRIREERARLEAIKKEKIRKQREFNEMITQGTVLALVVAGMLAAFGWIFYTVNS
jgi:hypothetical protein